MISTHTNKNNKLKHVVVFNEDNLAIKSIKSKYGLATDSQAIRYSIRKVARSWKDD
jgi:hypothetical protein